MQNKLIFLSTVILLFLSVMVISDSFGNSLDTGLIAAYKFNETGGSLLISNAFNTSENGVAATGTQNGTIGVSNTAIYQTNAATIALTLSDYKNYVPSFAGTNLSYSFWINKQSDGDDGNELFFQKPVAGAVTGIGCADGAGSTEISCGFYQGGVGWNKVGVNNLNIGQWYHIYICYDSNINQVYVYRDNDLKGNTGFTLSDTVETTQINFDQAGGEKHSNNLWDEFYIWSRCLEPSELALINYTFIELADSAPDITFINKTPTDLNILNGFNNSINVFYNITDDVGLSFINFSFKVNTSSGLIESYINNTPYINNWLNAIGTNESDIYRFHLTDNKVYPASYNYNETVMETSSKTPITLTSNTAVAKIEFLNVSLYKYYVAECYLNNSAGSVGAVSIYAANSTYTTGNIDSSQGIELIGTIEPNAEYNHIHSANSKHYVIGFINTSVPRPRYLLIRGAVSSSWYLNIIPQQLRSDVWSLSDNNGNSYTGQSGTPDCHIHYYADANTLCYYVSANDTIGQTTISDVRCDNLGLTYLPPNPPIVFSPTASVYTGSFYINWTNSTPFYAAKIQNYSISLLYSNNLSLKQNIATVNSTTFKYLFDSSGIASGNFTIKVTVSDNESMTSSGYSQDFNIDNAAPAIFSTPIEIFLNSSIAYVGAAYPFQIDWSDYNLFWTEFVLYLNNGTIIYNDTVIRSETVTAYTLIDSITVPNGSIIKGYAYGADGHTLLNIKDKLIENVVKTDKQTIQSDCFTYELLDDTDTLDLLYTDDRAYYTAKYTESKNIRQIKITPLCKPVMPLYDVNYNNYLIIEKYWVDFKASGLITVNIADYKDYFIVTQYFKDSKTDLTTNSIGLINEVRKDFFISVATAPTASVTELTTQGVLFLVFMLMFYAAFMIFAIITKIPFLWFFAGAVGILTGIGAYPFLPSNFSVNFLVSIIWVMSGFINMTLFFIKIRLPR